MRHAVLIENIVRMRRQAGIDDADLRDAIPQLTVGDLVRLTLRTDQSTSWEEVVVRITEIGPAGFRGVLAGRPTAKGLSDLGVGFALGFTSDHIHSIPNGRKADIR